MHSKTLSRIARWARNLFLGALLLLGLGILITQTPWFRNLVRSIALSAIDNAIRGTVQIGAIDGNLLTTIQLKDVVISEERDTIATVPDIRLRFHLPGILQGKLDVDSVMVDMPQLSLRQHHDGTWNLLTAFASAVNREEKEDTSPSSFRVTVNHFVIRDARIRAFPADTSSLFPREALISIGGSGSYSEDHQELDVTTMEAQLRHPDIDVTRCTFRAEHTMADLSLSDFILTTRSNRIEASGRINTIDGMHGSAKVTASLPDLKEIAFIVPEDFQSMHPELHATVEIQGEQLNIWCSLKDGRQVVQGNCTLVQSGLPIYRFTGEFQHLDPDVLRGAIPKGLDMNGSLEFQGQGFHRNDAVLHCKAAFSDSRIGVHQIKRLRLDADYTQGNIAVKGRLEQGSGFFEFGGKCDVFANSPRYSIHGQSQNLDIASMLGQPVGSRITLHLAANGAGFAYDRMEGDIQASFSRSMIGKYEIDSAEVYLRALHGDLMMDSLFVESPAGNVRGKGKLSRGVDISALFTGELRDAEQLREVIPVEKLSGGGTFGGIVIGKLDSLVTSWNAHLYGLALNDLSADSIEGTGNIVLNDGTPSVYGRASVKGLLQGGTLLDSLNIEGEYWPDSVHAIIDADDSTLFLLHADAFARIDTTTDLTIREFETTLGASRWTNGSQPIAIDIGKSSIDIRKFTLTSGEQSIVLKGLIAPKELSGLECTIHNVDLLPFAHLIDTAFTSLGPLDAHITVADRMDNPTIEGTVTSSRVAYGGWASDSLNGSFDLRDSTFRWDIAVGLVGGNNTRISGYLPVQYGAADGIVSRTRPADIHLFAPHLDLSTLIRPRKPFDTITGTLSADMHLTHTLQSPSLLGTIGIEAGSLQSTSLGLSYKDINLQCTGMGDSLVIDSCQVRGGKGVLTAKGTVGLGSSLSQGKVGTTYITISARNFEAASTSNYAATVNGTTTIRNKENQFIAEGELAVSNADIYLPYFSKTSGTKEREHSLPMLVAAAQPDSAPGESRSTPVAKAGTAARDTTQLFVGKFRVTIPRGTWVRGKNLNIELSGKLDIVKTPSAVSLLGFIKCERGTYEFYGKKFVVKEGRFDFDGETTEFNPTVAIDMRYDFRDSYEQEQTLHMIMSSRLKDMNIRFTFGDEAITDADAISYLLFGRRSDELSQAQQAGMANVGEVVAKDFAAGIVSAQLSSTVGNWAGLDVVRVSGEDNWQKATFTAGKYVTNNIFVTYERGLFTSDPNEPIKELARMEYQLLKFLYLQLTKANDTSSGSDLIIKIE